AYDYTFSAPTQTITLDVITPVNGKNVLNLEGNSAYICLGKNGVKRYTTDVWVDEFSFTEKRGSNSQSGGGFGDMGSSFDAGQVVF
ncbi:MAG: hypothetical protein IKW14_03775, partial [Phascolarctobacterium sp.]|nr:hypothetical protein [Phascolarctobacterium sp.]